MAVPMSGAMASYKYIQMDGQEGPTTPLNQRLSLTVCYHGSSAISRLRVSCQGKRLSESGKGEGLS